MRRPIFEVICRGKSYWFDDLSYAREYTHQKGTTVRGYVVDIADDYEYTTAEKLIQDLIAEQEDNKKSQE